MALRSGLLSESTWAVDVLAVLLRDDVTVAWFGLQHLPGLVDVLLDHLRRCLIELFPGDFDDLEVMCDSPGRSANSREKDTEDWKTAEEVPSDCPSKSTRPVQVETNSPDEDLVFDDKRWDIYGDVDSSMLDWQIGRGDLTTHIQTHFSHLRSLDFAGSRFFGKPNLSAYRTSDGIQRVGGEVPRNELPASSPVGKIAENCSSFHGGDARGTTSECFSFVARAETAVSSKTDNPSPRPAEKVTEGLLRSARCFKVFGRYQPS